MAKEDAYQNVKVFICFSLFLLTVILWFLKDTAFNGRISLWLWYLDLKRQLDEVLDSFANSPTRLHRIYFKSSFPKKFWLYQVPLEEDTKH